MLLERIPGEVEQLWHLTELSLVSLPSLKVLQCILSLQSLQILHLQRLERVTELNSSLWGLRALLYLHLDSMPITHISDSIGELTQLLSLKLSNLCIRDLPLGLLALQNLSMTECSQCSTSNGVLAGLRMLRTVELKIPRRGHQRVFVELPAAVVGLQALQTLELDGLLDAGAQSVMREVLMQPPERLEDVHVNGKFFDFWRTGFLYNKGLELYETPLTFAKLLQERTLMFVASRWTRGGQVGTEMPPDVIRKICTLANDGMPPQDDMPPQDEENWV